MMMLCKDDFKKIGSVLLISLIGGTLLTYFSCPNCIHSFLRFCIISLVSSITWFFIWLGNSMLGGFINKKYSWTEEPIKRFIIGSVTTIVYTLLMVVILLELFAIIFHFDYGDQYKYSIYSSIVITILISLFLHSRSFLISWRKAIIDGERLQKESIVARYESLKSQVNPHFLFNSLNALTNLVYEDPDKAVKFIKQLSEVYRYVLDTRDREVVAVEEELSFLDSYLFLQKIRFGDNLQSQINVSSAKAHIAPLALQMLIENAIKHNIVSSDDPLMVNIFERDDYIFVENNLQKKSTLGEPSSGMGLENICKRYEFLSDRKVEIVKSEDKFSVKLPLIHNGKE
jgi:sensor histidine kinase YesM